jgi:hypothetical protein
MSRVVRLFLGWMGVVYVSAFASLLPQVRGLYGSTGVLPVEPWLTAVASRYGAEAFWRVPTLLWWSSSDLVLQGLCLAGILSGIGLMLAVLPRWSGALAWVSYLSLVSVGRVFLNFQWDALLLEVGFLAIWLAPGGLRPWRTSMTSAPLGVVWLLRWVLARLMFASGVVKLASGDPAWRELTALRWHFWTQPLPAWPAWFADGLGDLVLQGGVAAMLVIELVLPFFVFGPRSLRALAMAGFVLLQLLIAATGSYGWFNLLTLGLCVLLLDDAQLARMLPWSRRAPRPAPVRPRRLASVARLAHAFLIVLCCVGGATTMALRFMGPATVPWQARRLVETLAPWHIVGSYGLFAVMTKSRREIVFEGRLGQGPWLAYELPYKPGDIDRRPVFSTPHMPRLDWQLWFAALSDLRHHPWVPALMQRMTRGDPTVLSLFATDPFRGVAPDAVRAVVYEYRFASPATTAGHGSAGGWEVGRWWSRRALGSYAPPVAR